MRRQLQAFLIVLCASSAVRAQIPQQPFPGSQPGQFGGYDQFPPPLNPNSFMPNIYNQQNQPLSPYLYTVRGTNPSVDYFFGTRPGTLGLGARGMGGAPFVSQGGMRRVFFPQLAAAPEPLPGEVPGESITLPPAGHPVVFNNTLGFFPSAFGQQGGKPGLGNMAGGAQKKQ